MQALNEKLVYLYHLFPPYNLGRSLVQLSALDFRSQILGKPTDPFKWNILGRPLTYMISEIFGYLLLTILIDNGTLLKAGGFVWAYVSPASLEALSRQCDSFSGITSMYFRSSLNLWKDGSQGFSESQCGVDWSVELHFWQ